MAIKTQNLIESLVKEDLITAEEAEDLFDELRDHDSPLDVLEASHDFEREQLLELYADSFGLQFTDLSAFEPDPNLLEMLDGSTVQQYFIFPLRMNGQRVVLATDEPPDIRTKDDIAAIIDRPVEFVLADPGFLEDLITTHYGASMEDIDTILDDLGEDQMIYLDDEDEQEDVERLEEQAEEAPIIKLVNMMITEAVRQGTSDIHIEPMEDRLLVRYRIDGILHEAHDPPKRLQGAIISRIKIMASMDISEHRKPQDGRIKLKLMGKALDFRVNSLPSIHGESVVLRILDQESIDIGLEQLGFLPDNLAVFDQLISRPNGIILVTGPTGSGKTTTLYSALSELNSPERKLITIENPVEYQLEGINQMQINESIGLDFAMGLRSLLRQSPDIILVGEIRDYETAEIAIRAALTGHLVFSTLHTNDAPSTINRLLDLGLNPFLISSSLQAIMAQRLVRTICDNCKEPYQPEPEYIEQVGFPPEEAADTEFYRGSGCDQCNMTGYSGRTAIFELMVCNQSIGEMILNEANTAALRKEAVRSGMRTLRQDGFIKVRMGETTLMEVARVTQAHGTAAAV